MAHLVAGREQAGDGRIGWAHRRDGACFAGIGSWRWKTRAHQTSGGSCGLQHATSAQGQLHTYTQVIALVAYSSSGSTESTCGWYFCVYVLDGTLGLLIAVTLHKLVTGLASTTLQQQQQQQQQQQKQQQQQQQQRQGGNKGVQRGERSQWVWQALSLSGSYVKGSPPAQFGAEPASPNLHVWAVQVRADWVGWVLFLFGPWRLCQAQQPLARHPCTCGRRARSRKPSNSGRPLSSTQACSISYP